MKVWCAIILRKNNFMSSYKLLAIKHMHDCIIINDHSKF